LFVNPNDNHISIVHSISITYIIIVEKLFKTDAEAAGIAYIKAIVLSRNPIEEWNDSRANRIQFQHSKDVLKRNFIIIIVILLMMWNSSIFF
jgi:hypothetical protein